MKNVVKIYSIGLLVCILLMGFVLRRHHFTVWPREGATFDEFAWTFLGISMLQSGIPTSWSPHAAYTLKQEYYNPQGTHFTLVTPYLEHPPLFGLVAGLTAKIQGITRFEDLTINKIRPLALALGMLSIVSVYLLANAVYGPTIGLISSFIYAITPSVVIGSRLVQNENFFIPFFLLSLYFTFMYIKKLAPGYLYVSVILCALLPLAKIPWIAAPAATIAMLAHTKKWKEAGLVCIATILGISLFLVWGSVLNQEVFVNLWKLQLARYDMTFDSFYVLFRDPLIVDRFFIDGWIYFGWLAIALLLRQGMQKHSIILFGFLAYAFVFLFAIPSEPLHGWYRYPFYPFLSIATAIFLYEHTQKQYLAMGVFFTVVGLSMLANSWGRTFGFSYIIYRLYILGVSFSILPSIFSSQTMRKYSSYMVIVLSCVILLSTWFTAFSYTEQ